MSEIVRREIPWTAAAGGRPLPLGRHVAHDERSRGFEADTAAKLASVNHASVGLPLDQGNVGRCTADAACGALNTDPNKTKLKHGPFTQRGANILYGLETKNEGQPWPPNDPGGSGLEVAKAAKQLGWITSYTHAFSIRTALLALVKRPVISGFNWYDSMDHPDKNGLVSITSHAQIRGGHETEPNELIVPDGATTDDLDEILVGIWNSWGKGFGKAGRYYMTAATWKRLLDEQGDCTVLIV